MKFSWVNAFICLLALSAPVVSWSAPDVTPRIFNGQDAASAPSYMAFIAVIPNETGQGGQCGASLITSRWLLTAAHCVEFYVEGQYTIQVIMGAADITSDTADVFGVDTVVVHPDYNDDLGGAFAADLALLRLDRDATGYNPLPILNGAALANLPDLSSATIYGWGLTANSDVPPETLQVADVDYLSVDACNEREPWDGQVQEDSVCSVDALSGVCSGDSGGPLVVNREGTEYLIGVASYVAVDATTGNCIVGTPDVYMSPAYYYGWIAEVAGLVTLEGDTSFGYVGVNQSIARSYALINAMLIPVDITSLAFTGADADKFTLADNQCIGTLAAGARCALTVIASASIAGEAQSSLTLNGATGTIIRFGFTASFLGSLAVDDVLRINAGQWYSNSSNGWVQANDMGSRDTLGFKSGDDFQASHLLLHVSGPLQLVMDGSSLSGALFDGVSVHLDDKAITWYRLDSAETALRLDIPEGAHRVLFTYEKQTSEVSQIGIYNFRTAALGCSGGGGGDSGGSIGVWLLLVISLLGLRRFVVVTRSK